MPHHITLVVDMAGRMLGQEHNMSATCRKSINFAPRGQSVRASRVKIHLSVQHRVRERRLRVMPFSDSDGFKLG